MNLVEVKIRVVFLGFILASAATVYNVRANINDFNSDFDSCQRLSCPGASESYESQCSMNVSTAIVVFKDIDLEREYYVLVVYNQTWCQAFLRPNIRQWIAQVKTTKSCKVTFCPNQSGEDQKKSKRRKGKEMTDECDTKLKVSFEHDQPEGVLIAVIRNRNRPINEHTCRMSETYKHKEKQGCTCLEGLYTEETSVNNSRTNSTSNQKQERNRMKTDKTERQYLMTYCLVVSCLLLEACVCVVTYLCVWSKYCKARPEIGEAEHTATVMANPSYQPGLQRPQISEPLRPPAPQPYQPLIVGTRGPGVSAEYRKLQIELRDDHKIGIPVDLTDYQDLDQSTQAQKYQVLVAEAAFEGRQCRKDGKDYDVPKPEVLKETDANSSSIHGSAGAQAAAGFLHSLRTLAQSAMSRGSGTTSLTTSQPRPVNQPTNVPLYRTLGGAEVTTEKGPGVPTQNNYGGPNEPEDQMHRVTEELEAAEDTSAHYSKCAEEHLYYVLEGPSPTSKDPMYHVLKELRDLNATRPERVPSSDSIADPLYYVLENPDDLEDNNAEEQTKL